MLPFRRGRRGNQAKPAADITDWTALSPDDFFAALKTACRAKSVPAAAVPETERRLAGGVLQARELHQILLTSGQNDKWAFVRQAALVALTERPDMAVTVVHLESQRLGSPAAFEETPDGAGFTARAALTVDGQPVTGQPGQGARTPLGIQCVITRVITVAEGRFAPGHLGELTQLVPFEMVDEALAQTRTVQSRIRDLPSRVVVYLLLAACLFPELGYPGVWARLTAGLSGLPVAAPTAGALAQARRRVGVAPLRFLFDLLRGPAAVPRGGGTWWRGLLVCAVDGTILTVPDSPANLARFTKGGGSHGGTGYPQVRLLALLACGTRTIIDAVSGPTTSGETTYAAGLLRSLRAGTVVLLDRNFAAAKLIAAIARTEADVLVRVKNGRNLPVLARYRDGSYLSRMGTTRIRVIEAQITIATGAGRRTGIYRLATTLLDHRAYPAADLIRLYHQRWEIETAYLELKSTILGGRVLRARTLAGIDQEIYALLVTYQILRTAMADATASVPGTDPDRASFTIAWQTARDQLIQAAGIIASTVIDLTGTIGRHVLTDLLPARRLRVSPRIIKRAISKYQARGPGIDRTSYKATVSIDILAPPKT